MKTIILLTIILVVFILIGCTKSPTEPTPEGVAKLHESFAKISDGCSNCDCGQRGYRGYVSGSCTGSGYTCDGYCVQQAILLLNQ